MFENLTELFAQLTLFPPLSEETLLYYIMNIFLIGVVMQSFHMIYILVRNQQLAWVATPYNSTDERDRKILILGDSTAVGTGADKAEDTIAGRLARDFPNVQIVNRAINGSRVQDMIKQIESVQDQKFDMIVISSGANDVWHYTPLNTIIQSLDTVLKTAIQISDHRVIFLINDIIASAPIFPSTIKFILHPRCDSVHEVIRAITHKQQIPTIELSVTEDHSKFKAHPELLFAADGIHPSSDGYRVWYNRMWREMTRRGLHFES